MGGWARADSAQTAGVSMGARGTTAESTAGKNAWRVRRQWEGMPSPSFREGGWTPSRAADGILYIGLLYWMKNHQFISRDVAGWKGV